MPAGRLGAGGITVKLAPPDESIAPATAFASLLGVTTAPADAGSASSANRPTTRIFGVRITAGHRNTSRRLARGRSLAPAGELALGDLAEAAHLLEVEPVAGERRRGRQLEATHQLVRDERPGIVLLDQVPAHLEVALPAEVRRVVVGGQACEPRLERHAERRAAEAHSPGVTVDLNREPQRRGKAVRRHGRERGRLVAVAELIHPLVPARLAAAGLRVVAGRLLVVA